MEKGTLLKVRTKTLNDVFGEVLYEVTEISLPAPEKERAGQMDGVRCVMLGGTGPRARKGYTVTDSEYEIQKHIASGETTIVPLDQRDNILAMFAEKKANGGTQCSGGTGAGL